MQIAINLTLDNRVNKSGKSCVFCTLTLNKEIEKISTKVFVAPKEWDKNKKKVKGNTIEARNANEILKHVQNRLDELLLEARRNNEILTPESLKSRYFGNMRTHTVLSLINLYAENRENKNSVGTKKTYVTRFNNIKDFIKNVKYVDDLPCTEVKRIMAEEMYSYFSSIRKFNHNHTRRQIMFLKAVFEYAYANELIARNPFTGITYPNEYKEDIVHLTYEEMEKLCTHSFEIERLQKIADCFIVQCFTGLSYADLKKLTSSNIRENPHDKNRKWIYVYRTKTKNPAQIPLLPAAQKILDKYNGIENLPIPTNEKFNAYLKEIQTILGFQQILTTHVGRKSFAMMCLNKLGMSYEIVASMLGQKGTQTLLKHYVKFNEVGIAREAPKFWNFFEESAE